MLAAEGAHTQSGEAPDRQGRGAVATTSLVVDELIRRSNLTMFMEFLELAMGPKLLRLKGILRLADDPDHPYVINAAQSHVHPITRLDDWPSDDRRTRLVAFTEGLLNRRP